MTSNFKFLENNFPILYQIGSTAEKYLYTDHNSCLIKLGMFGETVVNLMFQLDSIEPPKVENTHANRIRLLKRAGMIPYEIDDILYALRKNRNDAIHANLDDGEKCKTLLQMAHNLGSWFMQVYGDYSIIIHKFVLPLEDNTDYTTTILNQEKLIKELNAKIASLKPQVISSEDRAKRSKVAVSQLELSEKETRHIIDAQLRKVGWEVDTENLRYSKGTRPEKGKNLAIAEWPTDSKIGKFGFADYALFVGEKLVAIIEAKKMSEDISSVLDMQGKEYASMIKEEHFEFLTKSKYSEESSSNPYKVPFIFATNGRKYLEQIKEKSGIWFQDLRNNSNIPKVYKGWMSPEGIMELLEKDTDKANEVLNDTPYDILKDMDGLNLRYYQIDAIEAAEKAIANGSETVLLSMATGTGKTRTILGMIYRFLKSNRFKRILFLVDRTALGEQAQDVFKEVKLEDLMTLDEIYDIKNLDDNLIDKETKVQVATVQSLVKRILYNEKESIPAISDYDLIIIDEAHRGYTLDKELDEDEFLYRNQDDFVSKYRTIVDYFDAVKVALTATPAYHTTNIFGTPVYTYSYRKAVVDGYLVDHDAPHILKTKLSSEGIKYEKGEILAVYDPITGEVTNSEELEDELKFDIEQFNRNVITSPYNRAVLEEIAKYINPEGDGKTLIFASNDNHADLIVNTLRDIYEPMGVDHKAILKITGKTGDKRRVLEAIKRFKNDKYPNIAVTVDLLTTGIDVPQIDTLVFMRRVKSRILYDQMIGRATRLCDDIGKSHFEIFDPAGIYDVLNDISNTKPVVVNSTASFDDLLKGIEVLNNDEQIENQIDLIITKIRRKEKRITEKQREKFELVTGIKNPIAFIEKIRSLSNNEAKNYILDNEKAFKILNEKGIDARKAVVISDKEDELISHTRGYGDGKKPEDYLESFKDFIENNVEKIEALNIVCTRPSSLTRQGLKSLKTILDEEGFTETQLNSAWNTAKNEDILADIITFIRSQAVGAKLFSHEERIKSAIAKLRKAHKFNKQQSDWLKRIEANLLVENVLNEETFNVGAFKTEGGFKRMDVIFENNLNEYIVEINKYLYEDGGSVA